MLRLCMCACVCVRDTNKDGHSNKLCSLVLLLVKTITASFASKYYIFLVNIEHKVKISTHFGSVFLALLQKVVK